jgi:hypothetical protein
MDGLTAAHAESMRYGRTLNYATICGTTNGFR